MAKSRCQTDSNSLYLVYSARFGIPEYVYRLIALKTAIFRREVTELEASMLGKYKIVSGFCPRPRRNISGRIDSDAAVAFGVAAIFALIAASVAAFVV